MWTRVSFIAVAIIVGVSTRTMAQQVAGTWAVTYDSDIRQDGEKITVTKRSQGKLTLEQKGDSVFGTFKPDGGPDASARSLTGTLKGKTLSLTTGTVRRNVNINGTATAMSTRTDWIGAVEATEIRGTMLIQMGDRQTAPRRWEAVAEKR
jgi:hypothetical protein